ncbi:aspartate ammonia-lyase [Endozoicomonas sp. OPT23]|uniref:class II fumarate hydratase n=1 Tax=Endozoicomonas sp. OPT23 TaxID=2072845 RepID=UPI00129B216A|nr:class II fumarate hydratase [Endozoicomonas sp. OPT23]MRI32845.1 aspartate ammonia-lyase [Endozoicomonas sp. OPT23]
MKTNATPSDTERVERDSLGEVFVPKDALYGAQTQRAINNFPVSGQPLPTSFISAIAHIKKAAANTNHELGLLSKPFSEAIIEASEQIISGKYTDQFPVDVYQTGSGTSSNMNVNEVISHVALMDNPELSLTPNDHVNMGQSSNDVIPSAIHVSSAMLITKQLLPAMNHLLAVMNKRRKELQNTVKTGRTHLMDAMPVTFGQEISGWISLIEEDKKRIKHCQTKLCRLTLGGTAVGTGTNTDPHYSVRVCHHLKEDTGICFKPADNFFAAQSMPASALEFSSCLRSLATTLMKIANDLRLMNSGPLTGLAEIELPAIQPGSSIMPGKVNPVISESVTMASAQVIGLDAAITIAAQSGNFQLNVMLPLIANNLIQSVTLISNSSMILADSAVKSFKVREAHINEHVGRNPVLVTALNPVIGYMKAAEIAKKAYHEGRPVLDVALENTDLSEEELKTLLDPLHATKGGLH